MSLLNKLAILTVVAVAAGVGGAVSEYVVSSDVTTNAVAAPPVVNRVPASKSEMQLSFAPVVEAVAPAVVNVYATRRVQQRSRSPFFDDPFFERFFGGNGFGQPRERVERSLGSGVIVDPSGVIVTNHHVIKGATEVRVALADRTEFDADIILDEERTDLAILKIRDAKQTFPSLGFADSDELKVGDLVLAIGNPFGVGQTVTSGIVSALARTHVGISNYQFFIQTDAAINPGNSGGALVDVNGRLVGVNTAIFSRSGGSNGIGFAIPANMVRLVAEGAISGKGVERAWFGGSLQTVTADIAEGLGLERPRGVLVTGLDADGPAEEAGLQIGDLLLQVNGKDVDSPDAFEYRYATVDLGDTVQLTILRDGTEKSVTVRTAKAPERPPRDAVLIDGYSPFGGATVYNLSPAVAQELGVDTGLKGVVVAKVEQGSTADRLGVRVGDIIRRLNGEVIRTTRVLEILTGQNFRLWRMEIERNGQTIKTTISG